MSKHHSSQFKCAFLHPRYWLFWLAVGVFWLVLCLPYPILRRIGNGLSWLFGKLKVGKRRAKIARRNLALAFPDMPESRREEILNANLKGVGMAIIETGMAWFWSDHRIKKWSKVDGIEYLNQHTDCGVLFVGVHFLTLELGARIVGLHHSGIGVYRPNDNPVLNWLQIWGRSRSNRHLLDRKDVRGMVKSLRNNETIWYAPDHDYGRKNSVFVPFFAVLDAATTTGTYFLLHSAPNTKVVPFAPLRNADGSGYTVTISPAVDFSDLDNATDVAARMNKVVEKEIMKGVEQYMWLHRRFKTRPDVDAPKLYD